MTLLERAKRDYPAGTKFISPQNGKVYTIGYNTKEKDYVLLNNWGVIIHSIQNSVFGEYVYINGKWAEIIDNFVLPEKWCCKGYKEVAEYSNIHGVCKGIYSENLNLYHHYPSLYFNATLDHKIFYGYTEITLEQFKKYVLKMDKKIIGYRLLKDSPECKKGDIFKEYDSNASYYKCISSNIYYNKSTIQNKEWFEPIYEEDDITIGSYKVHLNEFGIKVGCRIIPLEDIKALKSAIQLCNKYNLTIFDNGTIDYPFDDIVVSIKDQVNKVFKYFNL